MLHAALPALEALYKAWSAQKMMAKYSEFYNGLVAGLAKVTEYYDCTADSDAYVIAMCKSEKMCLSLY